VGSAQLSCPTKEEKEESEEEKVESEEEEKEESCLSQDTRLA